MSLPISHNLRDPTDSILHALKRIKEGGNEKLQQIMDLGKEAPTVRVEVGGQTVSIKIFDPKFKEHTSNEQKSHALLNKFFKAVKNNKAAYKLDEISKQTGQRQTAYFFADEAQKSKSAKPHKQNRISVVLSAKSQQAITSAANKLLEEISSASVTTATEHKKETTARPIISSHTHTPSIKLAVVTEKLLSKTEKKVPSVSIQDKKDAKQEKEGMEEEQTHIKEGRQRRKEALLSEKRDTRDRIDLEHQERRLDAAKVTPMATSIPDKANKAVSAEKVIDTTK